ncbi:MAG: hypothetical protein PQJ59_01685 [Spirochaetales bacterium]|nr:hypothetical protein [Spirochaetales bacterium]
MNQDQVKEKLLELDSEVEEFQVIFSGKASRRWDGKYYPDTHEIVINNKNFEDDNSLMYTALHEFAHHIQFTRHAKETTSRAHTNLFWSIFHKLLHEATEKGTYTNIYDEDPRFREVTEKIQEDFIQKNGELMKALGKMLVQALDLCQQKHVIFEDYIERELGLTRSTAKSAMMMFARDVDPSLGFDKMKMVAAIKEPKAREEATRALKDGKTQNEVKEEIKAAKAKPPKSEYSSLKKTKKRLEKSIEELTLKLEDVTSRIETLEDTADESPPLPEPPCPGVVRGTQIRQPTLPPGESGEYIEKTPYERMRGRSHR